MGAMKMCFLFLHVKTSLAESIHGFIIAVCFFMKLLYYKLLILVPIAFSSCNGLLEDRRKAEKDTISVEGAAVDTPALAITDTVMVDTVNVGPPAEGAAQPLAINTKNISPDQVIAFAETLIGTPYQYASTDPKTGFDCSGFITYVFTHFNIQVPRSSIDFTNVGTPIEEANAKRGDIILFTGTNPAEKFVGHMGLITKNSPQIEFIHSSSGKAHGVTVTPLNDYYRTRFVKIIRIFKQNDL
jgi:cell wall-associated NlpC family hydrolase